MFSGLKNLKLVKPLLIITVTMQRPSFIEPAPKPPVKKEDIFDMKAIEAADRRAYEYSLLDDPDTWKAHTSGSFTHRFRPSTGKRVCAVLLQINLMRLSGLRITLESVYRLLELCSRRMKSH